MRKCSDCDVIAIDIDFQVVVWQTMKNKPARLVFRRITKDGKVGPYSDS